ncbi:MAG: tetratricopeptide repeat protein [Endomicrobiales bacterium]|nr:tetratricopeptide repeat protein [Endomicrobiales bacterium]
MNKILLLYLLTQIITCPLWAQNDYLDAFKQANQLYEKGKYEDAVKIYESLIEKGQINASVYYNLGNAYFKNHQIGYALANYERAKRIDPRDKDIRFNIDHIKLLLKEPPLPFWEETIESICGFVTLNELTVICLIFFISFISGAVMYLITRQQRLIFFNALVFLSLIFFVLWFAIKYNLDIKTKWAVIIESPVEARNGPGFDNSVGFTISEGKKVVVLGQKNEWAAIGLKSEGLKGWVEDKYLEKI